MRSPAVSLLERDDDLRVLGEVIESARRGSGRLVVIEGEAGIGKSTLVAAALEAARRAGISVLRTRGSELERQYPYGVALGLYEPLVSRGDRPLLAGAAAAAGPLFSAAGEPAPAVFNPNAVDPFAMVHGLYWLTLNATETEPLVLAVDDAQWADEASLRLLHYIAQRVEELPLVLILAFRSGPHAEMDLQRSIRTSPGAIRIEPAPLSRAGVGEMLAAAGVLDADGSLADAYWSATRGNPFFVAELIRAHDPSTADVIGARTPAPVPGNIARFVEERIQRLDPGAHRIAEAVSILGEDATIQRVADLTGLPPSQVNDIARSLTRAAVLEPFGALDFAHPIVRAAVYGSIPSAARARLHRLAGILLGRTGAASGVVGAQLLIAERTGDEDVVRLLESAADEAVGHGQAAAAAELLRRALDEPPTAECRLRVLLSLARAEGAAGSPDATARYEEVVDAIDDPVERASLLLEQGHVLIGAMNWSAATSAFERGLAELASRPHPVDGADVAIADLRDRLEAGFVSAAWVGIERHDEAVRTVERLIAEGSRRQVHRELVVWAAFQRSIVVDATASELSRTVREALADVPVEQLITQGQIVEVAAGVLVTTDDLTDEIDLLTRAIAAAEAAGSYGKVGLYSYCRSLPHYYTGALTDAIADAQASIRTAELGWETFLPGASAFLALSLLERGELAAANEAIGIDDRRWAGRVDFELLVPLVRGRIALAEGRTDAALEHLERAGTLPRAMGFRALVPPDWRAWTALTLSQLGRRTEARDLAEEIVAVGREWGARWTLGGALRVAGLVEGGPRGLELLGEAADLLETSPARLERTRVLVDLGAALRRAGYAGKARDVLTDALELAHRLDARLLLDRAREELRAAGSRPRRFATSGVAALTPAELRVARLASEGRTNRQIAQALFVTPKAVEYHLANAFPKLGIASRLQLGEVLQGVPSPADG